MGIRGIYPSQRAAFGSCLVRGVGGQVGGNGLTTEVNWVECRAPPGAGGSRDSMLNSELVGVCLRCGNPVHKLCTYW